MIILPENRCIRCHFDSNNQIIAKTENQRIEVYYAKSRDLLSIYSYLINYVSDDELSRAERFHFNQDKVTYICSHSILRLILSKELNIMPNKILFNINSNNKPGLLSNSLSFNITHTRKAFAVVISNLPYIGIDLEIIRNDPSLFSIIETFFSENEKQYILESTEEATRRFFLLWTRKEALLKAFGTGIIDALNQVEVFRKNNYIKKVFFDNLSIYSLNFENFVYSIELDNYFLSVATPLKNDIILNQITVENIDFYFPN